MEGFPEMSRNGVQHVRVRKVAVLLSWKSLYEGKILLCTEVR